MARRELNKKWSRIDGVNYRLSMHKRWSYDEMEMLITSISDIVLFFADRSLSKAIETEPVQQRINVVRVELYRLLFSFQRNVPIVVRARRDPNLDEFPEVNELVAPIRTDLTAKCDLALLEFKAKTFASASVGFHNSAQEERKEQFVGAEPDLSTKLPKIPKALLELWMKKKGEVLSAKVAVPHIRG